MIRFFIDVCHKKQKIVLLFLLVFIISPMYSFPQDFRIAPDTPILQERSNNYLNVSVASDTRQGFLVTWINTFFITNSSINRHLYACRFSKYGEMLDNKALNVNTSVVWAYFVPSAIFLGGNWIVAFNQGGFFEYLGAVRLTPSGEILDNPSVNICNSTGLATLLYPTIASNGKEILCVAGVAGEGLYGSIVDSALNVLVERFPIVECSDSLVGFPDESKPRVTTNGENIFVAFRDGAYLDGVHFYPHIKLIMINPEGEILSIQKVKEINYWAKDLFGNPMIITVNEITYVFYFYVYKSANINALFVRRYDSSGNPLDSSPIKIAESNDFYSVLYESNSGFWDYVDIVSIGNYFYFFMPNPTALGLSMFRFNSDLSTVCNTPISIDSDCLFTYETPYTDLGEHSSSFIRASSLGDNILTAWIDKRDTNTRVYGNFIDIKLYTGIKNTEPEIVNNYQLLQNYPNPFNPNTTISYSILKAAKVELKVFNLLGQEVATLVNEQKTVGAYEVKFDTSNLPSGVYIYKLQAGSFVEGKKMILVR